MVCSFLQCLIKNSLSKLLCINVWLLAFDSTQALVLKTSKQNGRNRL